MQIKTPYAFTLDIVKPTKIPIMEFYKTDVNTSQMLISITNNDEVVDLTGHTTILNIKKADGTEIQNLATVSDAVNGLINVSLTTQSLTAIGECRVQLTVFEGTNRKSTHEFKYYVKASLLNAEVPLSSNEYGLLLQLIDEVQTVENILNTSEAERVQAENTRVTNENNRIELNAQLITLQGVLEGLQTNLEATNTTVNSNETIRQDNEVLREQLRETLETLKTQLEDLKVQVETTNTTVTDNETQRQINETDREELKGQLESLKSTLESLENTLNTNDSTRTNTVNTKVNEVNNKITEANSVIADIQNRFALLQTSQQQASEVINARTSTTKAKTFASLGARIEETEQNILTSQATSVVDSVVPVNTLANSLDGATDISIKGMSLVQLVKNGNFVNTSGWSLGAGATNLTVSNNKASFVGDGISLLPNILGGFNNMTFASGKKLFIKARVKCPTGCTEVKLYWRDTVDNLTILAQSVANPTINTEIELKGIVTLTTNSTFGRVQVVFIYPDVATVNGKVMEVSNIMTLDLTALSLDTKIADEINAMLPSYFEGISSVENTVIKSIGENLFDKRLPFSEGKFIGIDGTLSTNSAQRTTDFIPIPKGNIYVSGFDNNIGSALSRVVLFDKNKNFLTYKTLTSVGGSFDNTNGYYIRMSLRTDRPQDIDTLNINYGTVAKAYTPYRESKITLSDYIEAQYFPLRSVSTVYDEVLGNKLYKRLGKSVLNGSESGWALEDSTKTNTLMFILGAFKTGSGADELVLSDKFASSVIFAQDTEGVYISGGGNLRVRISKTKVTDLATFKAWLSTNNTEILYKLATPTEITLDRRINLPIFKNGSIIQEPVSMYPKLSYTFPLNISTSVNQLGEKIENIYKYTDEIYNDLDKVKYSNVLSSDYVKTLTDSVEGVTKDIGIKGNTLINLVKNGNFASGTSGWAGANSTISATNNTLSVTNNGTQPYGGAFQNINTLIANRKYYARLKVRVTGVGATMIKAMFVNANPDKTVGTINNPTQNTWYTIFGIITPTTDVNNIQVYHYYADATTSLNKVLEVQEVMALDLTSLGLDTLSADQVNNMLNGYFECMQSISANAKLISCGENLFNKEKYTSYVDISKLIIGKTYSISSNTIVYTFKIANLSGDSAIAGSYSNVDKWSFTLTQEMKSIGRLYIVKPTTYVSYTKTEIDSMNIMLNEGTTPSTYKPYQSSEIELKDYFKDDLHKINSTLYDEVVGDKLYKRVGKVINPTVKGVSSLTETYRIIVNTPNSSSKTDGGIVYISNVPLLYTSSYSLDSEHYYHNAINECLIFISKSKIDSLVGATLTEKAQKYMENVICFYELATPTITTLASSLTVPTFDKGTIITDSIIPVPVTYDYPTNRGSQIDAITKKVEKLHDGQQFILSYLLDIETRLIAKGI